ncbi:hypothetical protein [Salinicola sp. RZ23]|uniref:hypothetical protein n=1 Tax=Salinicola sp. RZ23 TaxID=1949087 RepID=UPI000DA15A89|nr:hypothetical protein [Salinicola sp. RZ23]
MKLILTPQRQRDYAPASFSAEGEALTVTIGDTCDVLDFSQAGHGTFDDFASNTLPWMPVLKATKTEAGLTVWVLNDYGPEPMREDDEPDDEFAARYAAWDRQRDDYEVQL